MHSIFVTVGSYTENGYLRACLRMATPVSVAKPRHANNELQTAHDLGKLRTETCPFRGQVFIKRMYCVS